MRLGVSFDLINIHDVTDIMVSDYGLTNSNDQATSVEMVTQAVQGQLKQVYGWSDATTWAHLPSIPHNWADGSCSGVPQNPYYFL